MIEKAFSRTVDGQTLEVRQCGHCKAVPTDDEIREAMKWRADTQPICAICTKKVSYIHTYVSHQPEEGDRFSWKSYGDWEPVVRISVSQSTDPKLRQMNIWVHTTCFRKAVPNLDKFNESTY